MISVRSEVQVFPGPPLLLSVRHHCADPKAKAFDVSGAGAIAQLGERVLCKHEVVGSIPTGSTKPVVVFVQAKIWKLEPESRP